MMRDELDEDADPRVELAKMIYVLSKIRDVVECDDPRYPSVEWYMSKVEHVRRYLNEVFGDAECN